MNTICTDLPAGTKSWRVRPHQRPLILDLGANIGLATLYVAKNWPKAHIIAVEPNKANSLPRQEFRSLAIERIPASAQEGADKPDDAISARSGDARSATGRKRQIKTQNRDTEGHNSMMSRCPARRESRSSSCAAVPGT
jgi:hypothetical protein